MSSVGHIHNWKRNEVPRLSLGFFMFFWSAVVYMASARGEKPKPNIDEVTKELSMLQDTRGQVYRNKNVFMRAINKEKHFQQVVGGFIQGYELDNNLLENEFDMAEGLLIVQCGTKTSVPTQHPATFFKLQAMAGKTTAERIFEHSMKLRGSKAVATSYLIAYCVKLKRWIICYEKLTGYLEDNIKSLEPFYDVDNEMSHYWQNQLREIITALSDMGVSGTFHGGMSTPQNYTISSSGDIKLIGVRRSEEQKTIRDDLVDFEAFLSLKTTASTSSDWKGFKVLISSDAMLKLDTWTGAVLGHSLLLDPEAKRRSYLELYTWTDRIPYSQKIRFCNALWCCLPEHDGRKLAYYISACKICVQVASGEIYDGRIIYMDIIKFVKNLILHGKLKLSDLLGKINDMFPGFMSMAYAVSKFEQSDMNRLFAAKGNKLLYK